MPMSTTSPPILIGFAGGSGAGKTTLVSSIQKHLGNHRATIFSLDWYYKDINVQKKGNQKTVNFDHPESLDINLIKTHLDELKAFRFIDTPCYNFATHTRKQKTRRITTKEIILVEGILLLALNVIRPLIDIRIFIETPSDIRFIRRLTRDVKERGRTIESVTTQYLTTTRPMHIEWVEPSKKHADLIVSGEDNIENSTKILATKIENFLEQVSNNVDKNS